MVVRGVCPLSGVMVKFVGSWGPGLWVSIEVLLFILVSAVSSVVFSVFLGPKGVNSFSYHGFNGAFGQGSIDGRRHDWIDGCCQNGLGLTLFKAHLIPFHLSTVLFPGVGVLRV